MTVDLADFSSLIASVDENNVFQRQTTITSRMRLTLINSTVLYVRVNHVTDTGWIDYSYHWQSLNHQLIIRWDNAHDYPDLETSPYHQHVGSEENVQPSEPMTLEKVLEHIAEQLSPH